jgi:hypothetical protein
MNGENNHIYHTSALDGVQPRNEALPLRAWRWIFVGQLWMLAGFVGLSLIAIAASSLFYGGAGYGLDELLAMVLAGALLVLIAWLGVAQMLEHAGRELPREPGLDTRQTPRSSVSTRPAPAQAKITGITPTL